MTEDLGAPQLDATHFLIGDSFHARGCDRDTQSGSHEPQNRQPMWSFLHNLRSKSALLAEAHDLFPCILPNVGRKKNKWLTTQLIHTDRWLRSQRMVCGHNGNVSLRQENFGMEPIVIVRITSESNVRRSVTERSQERTGMELAQAQLDLGEALAVLAQHARQYCQHGRSDKSHSKRSHLAASDAS